MAKHLLKKEEKKRIFDIIRAEEVDPNLLLWKERIIGLNIFTVLLFQPQQYYFLFERIEDAIVGKNFFPYWENRDKYKESEKNDILEIQLHCWISGIKRIRKRQEQLFVPVDDGASRRRSFSRVSETIRFALNKAEE